MKTYLEFSKLRYHIRKQTIYITTKVPKIFASNWEQYIKGMMDVNPKM